LCGSGTRGDQVDNANYFSSKDCAKVLVGENANSDTLKEALTYMMENENRNKMKNAIEKLVDGEVPAKKIAKIINENIEK
jgi:UDP-N-acetylglucosamine--N-acetylmuramyl-(pentapeptide) pyrophosphoryl-undecaprenol N-acetylglucosamine transferase